MLVRNEDDGCQSVEEAVRGCALSTRSCTTITNVGAAMRKPISNTTAGGHEVILIYDDYKNKSINLIVGAFLLYII